jgi:hypothetical protein
MRRLMLLIAIGAALAGLATPSLAFQEQWVGGTPPDKAAIGPPSLQMPSLNLSVPDSSVGKGAGIEVRIPGVGAVGALPKLDFGLELLYGANEPVGGRPDDRSQPSDMQIRGTIKHRF